MFGIRKMKIQIEMLRSQVVTLQYQSLREDKITTEISLVQLKHDRAILDLEKNSHKPVPTDSLYRRLEMLERKMVKVK